MLRVRTDFTGMTTGPAVSTMYFDGAGAADAVSANAAVGGFWGSVAAVTIGYGGMTTESIVEEVGLTGTLLALWPVTPVVHAGTLTDDALPPATQGLLRLHTGYIVSGRQLVGRVFVPGACETGNAVGGVPTAGYKSAVDAAGATLIAAALPWVVWSRKHATSVAITSATTASKWAILRSRRD